VASCTRFRYTRSMAASSTKQKRHAHELIDRMAPAQLSVVVSLLEVMLDPLAAALANAPDDDEPVGEQEAREAEESKAALARGEGISHEKVLADFGLTSKDFERMGRTPLRAERRK
jgi:hypothetical protein